MTRGFEIERLLAELDEMETRAGERKSFRVDDQSVLHHAARTLRELLDTEKVQDFLDLVERVHVMKTREQGPGGPDNPIYRRAENDKVYRLRIQMRTGDVLEVMSGYEVKVIPRAGNVVWIEDEGQGLSKDWGE